MAHRGGQIRLDDLNYERTTYKAWPVYQQSKLAMLMFAIELDRRSQTHGWNLTSVAAHPGFARTDLIANGPAQSGAGGLMMAAGRLLQPWISHSGADGALPTLLAATQPRMKGGGYYGPQGFMEMKGLPGRAEIKPQALDTDVARKLWAESERLTGVRYG
jgi:NAD(P)-dependent dehydrogenase (short-subunit alcohol dehydrogenase family)